MNIVNKQLKDENDLRSPKHILALLKRSEMHSFRVAAISIRKFLDAIFKELSMSISIEFKVD